MFKMDRAGAIERAGEHAVELVESMCCQPTGAGMMGRLSNGRQTARQRMVGLPAFIIRMSSMGVLPLSADGMRSIGKLVITHWRNHETNNFKRT